jgi:hypothetical protein
MGYLQYFGDNGLLLAILLNLFSDVFFGVNFCLEQLVEVLDLVGHALVLLEGDTLKLLVQLNALLLELADLGNQLLFADFVGVGVWIESLC